jgi:hypothetical protein
MIRRGRHVPLVALVACMDLDQAQARGRQAAVTVAVEEVEAAAVGLGVKVAEVMVRRVAEAVAEEE